MTKSILITAHTWLKQSTRQAADLPADAKIQAKPGERFDIVQHEALEDISKDDSDQHIQFALAKPLNGKAVWFVYQRHASIMQGDSLLFPCPEVDTSLSKLPRPRTVGFSGIMMKLPSGETVYTDQAIIPGGNFSWGEATHNATRLAQMTLAHQNRIVSLAKQLQRVRGELGRPITVTSWFRPEPFNSRVGGARKSQHLTGGAVDITCEGYSGLQMAQKVRGWWPGGLGIYPGNRKHILHLDIGPKRSWGF